MLCGIAAEILIPRGRTDMAGGAGTELKRLLHFVGYNSETGCPCDEHAEYMDYMGVNWCRTHVDEIVGWLKQEAQRREVEFSERAARAIVKLAIRSARVRQFLGVTQ